MHYRKIMALAAGLSLSGGALAAEDVLRQDQKAEELRGQWVIGSTVRTPDGEVVGQIEDLIVDQKDGSVTAAILSVGGFLGFGAKNIAVKWNELQIMYDATVVRLDLTRQAAEKAPQFTFREQQRPPIPEQGAAPEAGVPTAPEGQ